MPRQLRKGGVIAALTGALFVTGVCAAVVKTDTEFRFVATALAKDKGAGGGHKGKSEKGKDKGGEAGQPSTTPSTPTSPTPSSPSASPSTPAAEPGRPTTPAATPRESSRERRSTKLEFAARKTDPIKTSSVRNKRTKTLMDMLATPPEAKLRNVGGKSRKKATLVEWFAEKQPARDGKASKAPKRQKLKSVITKRVVRAGARMSQAKAYAFRGPRPGGMEKEFRTRFFSQDPQMLAMRTYVLELAAFESARSLMVDAAADLDEARRKMLALDIAPFRSLRGTLDDDRNETALDPAEVAALIVARQKLSDAQENLAIKAQRVDFGMLRGVFEWSGAPTQTHETSAVAVAGGYDFSAILDVVAPLDLAPTSNLGDPQGDSGTQAHIRVDRNKQRRLGNDDDDLAQFTPL